MQKVSILALAGALILSAGVAQALTVSYDVDASNANGNPTYIVKVGGGWCGNVPGAGTPVAGSIAISYSEGATYQVAFKTSSGAKKQGTENVHFKTEESLNTWSGSFNCGPEAIVPAGNGNGIRYKQAITLEPLSGAGTLNLPAECASLNAEHLPVTPGRCLVPGSLQLIAGNPAAFTCTWQRGVDNGTC